eukprot:5228356-Alexandrium_andersonii.AAC.1
MRGLMHCREFALNCKAEWRSVRSGSREPSTGPFCGTVRADSTCGDETGLRASPKPRKQTKN